MGMNPDRTKCENAKSAQQSVHWTLGILRDFQAFFWLRVFSTSQTLSTPAPVPVTQTVGRSPAKHSF